MLSLMRPDATAIERLLAKQKSLSPTYSQIGATYDGTVPPGYGTNKVKGKLGVGAECFKNSASALKNWLGFGLDWITIFPLAPPFRAGETLLVQAHVLAIWSLNACRIIYTIDEDQRCGFAYGTLPEHAEIGEERFLIEWDRTTDEVTYEILAFSNPSRWYYWLVFPMHRFAQDKFRRDALALMKNLNQTST